MTNPRYPHLDHAQLARTSFSMRTMPSRSAYSMPDFLRHRPSVRSSTCDEIIARRKKGADTRTTGALMTGMESILPVMTVRSFRVEIETRTQKISSTANSLFASFTTTNRFISSTVSTAVSLPELAYSRLSFSDPPSQSQMREVINIHVGQAGVQIGNACCKSG